MIRKFYEMGKDFDEYFLFLCYRSYCEEVFLKILRKKTIFVESSSNCMVYEESYFIILGHTVLLITFLW